MQKILNRQLIIGLSLLLSISLLVGLIYLAFTAEDILLREFSKAVAFVCFITSIHLSTIIKITKDERIIETANN